MLVAFRGRGKMSCTRSVVGLAVQKSSARSIAGQWPWRVCAAGPSWPSKIIVVTHLHKSGPSRRLYSRPAFCGDYQAEPLGRAHTRGLQSRRDSSLSSRPIDCCASKLGPQRASCAAFGRCAGAPPAGQRVRSCRPSACASCRENLVARARTSRRKKSNDDLAHKQDF